MSMTSFLSRPTRQQKTDQTPSVFMTLRVCVQWFSICNYNTFSFVTLCFYLNIISVLRSSVAEPRCRFSRTSVFKYLGQHFIEANRKRITVLPLYCTVYTETDQRAAIAHIRCITHRLVQAYRTKIHIQYYTVYVFVVLRTSFNYLFQFSRNFCFLVIYVLFVHLGTFDR